MRFGPSSWILVGRFLGIRAARLIMCGVYATDGQLSTSTILKLLGSIHMRFVLVVAFSLAQLACSGLTFYSIQTDGSSSPPPMREPLRLAVWGTSPSIVGAATTWLQKRGATVIERSRLNQLLIEQQTQLRHTVDREADLLKVGQLAGVAVLVFADGNAIPGNASVVVRAVDVSTAVVLWSGSAQYTGQLVYVDYALAGLTCEALATAWGYRSPGLHMIPEAQHCRTP